MKTLTYQQVKSRWLEASKRAAETGKQVNVSCGGVILKVNPSGHGFWYARLKNKWTKLGEYGEMGLADARRRAEKLGSDRRPLDDAADDLTFGALWQAFLAAYKGTGKNDKRWSSLRGFTPFYAELAETPLERISPLQVIGILKKFKVAQNYRAMIFQGLKQAMDWAVMMEYVKSNPVAAISHSRMNPFKRTPTEGFAWIPAERLKEGFFDPLDALPITYRCLVLYLALSCNRLGEGQYLRWDWVNEKEGQITIPAEATKTNVTNPVPLTPQLRTLLANVERTLLGDRTGFIFRSNPAMDTAICRSTLSVLVRQGTAGKATLHGLRKSASTWMHEQGFGEAADFLVPSCLPPGFLALLDPAVDFYML